MTRISIKDLEHQVKRINEIEGMAIEPYTSIDGKITPNAGNYHLDQAYGGVKLVRMCQQGTGTTNITTGFISKKELYYKLDAIITGLSMKVNP